MWQDDLSWAQLTSHKSLDWKIIHYELIQLHYIIDPRMKKNITTDWKDLLIVIWHFFRIRLCNIQCCCTIMHSISIVHFCFVRWPPGLFSTPKLSMQIDLGVVWMKKAKGYQCHPSFLILLAEELGGHEEVWIVYYNMWWCVWNCR